MAHPPRSRVLVFFLCLVGSVATFGAGSPAGALSCVGLPDDLLEGIAAGEAPGFWGHADNVTSVVVARVAEQAPDPDGPRDDDAWLGTVDVEYTIGREAIDERVDVRTGPGSSTWGTGSLPAVGELVAIYDTRSVGDPEPEGLWLGICPNSESIDDDRAAAVLALATDSGVPILEPAPTTTITTTTTTPVTTKAPPTTTTAPQEPIPAQEPTEESSSTTGWIVGIAVVALAAGVAVVFARRGRR
ncbi:MAG: hypothetical protein DHS20C19_27350 [Acidimicrobiales bacterium]|nr:MAG: hypothetical protein DHS20C19_27350 [Acidimicrobiales bacterium]